MATYSKCNIVALNCLMSLDNDVLLDTLATVLTDRKFVLQGLINWALPEYAYCPADVINKNRFEGTVIKLKAGFGFIETPVLKNMFGSDVFVYHRQLRGLNVGAQVNFALMMAKDQKPQAYDVEPGFLDDWRKDNKGRVHAAASRLMAQSVGAKPKAAPVPCRNEAPARGCAGNTNAGQGAARPETCLEPGARQIPVSSEPAVAQARGGAPTVEQAKRRRTDAETGETGWRSRGAAEMFLSGKKTMMQARALAKQAKQAKRRRAEARLRWHDDSVEPRSAERMRAKKRAWKRAATRKRAKERKRAATDAAGASVDAETSSDAVADRGACADTSVVAAASAAASVGAGAGRSHAKAEGERGWRASAEAEKGTRANDSVWPVMTARSEAAPLLTPRVQAEPVPRANEEATPVPNARAEAETVPKPEAEAEPVRTTESFAEHLLTAKAKAKAEPVPKSKENVLRAQANVEPVPKAKKTAKPEAGPVLTAKKEAAEVLRRATAKALPVKGVQPPGGTDNRVAP